MKIKFVLFLLSLVCYQSFRQDPVQNYLKEATDFYSQKNYKQAQMSLQDAINAVSYTHLASMPLQFDIKIFSK